jgi:hypothetical protein
MKKFRPKPPANLFHARGVIIAKNLFKKYLQKEKKPFTNFKIIYQDVQTPNNFNVNNSNSSELNINDGKFSKRKINANNCGSSDHQCPQCDREFLSAKGLQVHNRMHANNENNPKMLDEKYIEKRIKNTESVLRHRKLNPRKSNAESIEENQTLVNEASKFEAFLTNKLGIQTVVSFKDKVREYMEGVEQTQEPELKLQPKKHKRESTLNVNNCDTASNFYTASQNLNPLTLLENALRLKGGDEEMKGKTSVSLIENPEKEQSIEFREAIQSKNSPNPNKNDSSINL